MGPLPSEHSCPLFLSPHGRLPVWFFRNSNPTVRHFHWKLSPGFAQLRLGHHLGSGPRPLLQDFLFTSQPSRVMKTHGVSHRSLDWSLMVYISGLVPPLLLWITSSSSTLKNLFTFQEKLWHVCAPFSDSDHHKISYLFLFFCASPLSYLRAFTIIYLVSLSVSFAVQWAHCGAGQALLTVFPAHATCLVHSHSQLRRKLWQT